MSGEGKKISLAPLEQQRVPKQEMPDSRAWIKEQSALKVHANDRKWTPRFVCIEHEYIFNCHAKINECTRLRSVNI